MELDKLSVGFFLENCYILHEEKEAVVIDPGDEDDRILDFIISKNLTVKKILLTHAHLDHIGAVHLLNNEFHPEIYLHENDHKLFTNIKGQSSLFGLAEIAVPDIQPFRNLCIIPFRNYTFEVIHTPGHTLGSVCYYLKEKKWLFTGDTLFKGAIGRTDLPGGDANLIIPSIVNNLLSLDGSTKIFPGHMESSTISHEKQFNNYLN